MVHYDLAKVDVGSKEEWWVFGDMWMLLIQELESMRGVKMIAI